MNHLRQMLVAALFLFLSGFGACPSTIEASQESRLYVNSEDCELGAVIVGVPNQRVKRCVLFKPALAYDGCSGWTSPSQAHTAVVNRLAGPVANMRAALQDSVSAYPDNSKLLQQGRVLFVKNSVGVQMALPEQIALGAKVDKLDLAVALELMTLRLSDAQLECLNAQSDADIKARVALNAGEQIEGFISKVDLGFSQFISLTSAELNVQPGSDIVKIKASSFNLAVHRRGVIDEVLFKARLEKLLSSSDHINAVMCAAELTSLAPQVTGGQTLFATTQRFPLLK